MAVNFEHPKGEVAIPQEWLETGRTTTEEFRAWLASLPSEVLPKEKGGKRNSTSGWYDDLDRYMRSMQEANWARYLVFLGYREWREKGDPPPGRWWRYEGREWFFKERTRNGRYRCDFEVWGGYFDPTRLYEVHEIKGWLDNDSKVRLKRMAQQYAEVPLELVTAPRMREETKAAKRHIATWDRKPVKKEGD